MVLEVLVLKVGLTTSRHFKMLTSIRTDRLNWPAGKTNSENEARLLTKTLLTTNI
jgi:hypothetical protein